MIRLCCQAGSGDYVGCRSSHNCLLCQLLDYPELPGSRPNTCAPRLRRSAPPSAPVERLRELKHALGRRVPAFRRMRVVVQVAAHARKPRAFREGEVPAPGRAGHVGVEFRQLRAVDEIDALFALLMRAAVEHVVGMRMGMADNRSRRDAPRDNSRTQGRRDRRRLPKARGQHCRNFATQSKSEEAN